jgi:4-diphosphocytidyl-2-C-methyl-D-erythritol kinase
MVAFPPCKINLGIHVLSRRDDGFHNIETCFYPLPRTDILEVTPSSKFSFVSTGLAIPGPPHDNLCIKAFELMRSDFDVPPVRIHLHKMVPAGAGLGGGSSDGAWTLRLLNSFWQLKLPVERLSKYADKLGSDCPFFLHDSPQIGSGKGEVLSPARVSLKGKYVVIVRPDVHVSTKSAYEGVVPRAAKQRIATIVEEVKPADWRGSLVNQFEQHVIELFPVIGDLKKELYNAGAFYASMTGSGSAVYGIFEREVNLRDKFGLHDFWSGWLTV